MVRQGSSLSPIRFNFVDEMVLEISISSFEITGTDICPDRNSFDFEYANDVE